MQIPEEIIANAKDQMLEHGGCPPTLFVVGTKRRTYMVIPGENVSERVENMTRAGIQLAQQGTVGDVQQVVFVSEAWTSPPREQFTMPSQDPDRTEVLVISALDV